MRKILLIMFLIVAVLMSVGNANAIVMFTGNIPDQVLTEDIAQTNIIDLSTYFTCTGTCSYVATGDTYAFLAVLPTGIVDFLASEDVYGIENVVFEATDSSDSSTGQSNIVEIKVNNVNDDPEITSVPVLTAKQGIEYKYDVNANDVDGNVLTYTLVAKPSGMEINSNTGLITWTPTDAQLGNNNVNVQVSDGNEGSDAQSFTINVEDVNYAPVFDTLIDTKYKAQEDMLFVLTLPSATDPDVGDTLTYTLTIESQPTDSTFTLANNFDDVGNAITWTPNKDDVDTLKLRWEVKDNGGPEKLVYQEYTIDVYPRAMCQVGEKGTDLSVNIESPGDNDNFGPGDTIRIEVNVDNDANEDKDVIVEAVLYDIEAKQKVDEVESDDEEIESGKDFEFKDLSLELSMDSDEDWKGTYVLYIKAYEDGEEDEQCSVDFVEIDIKRDKKRVIVNDVMLNPISVDSGETVNMIVDVMNIGKNEQDNVYVKVVNVGIGLDLMSDKVALGAYDESGNTHVFRFTNIEIPKTTDTGNYAFDVGVYYDGNSEKYSDSPTYEAIGSENVLTVEEPEISGVVEIAELEQATETSFSVPIIVTNTGDPGKFILSFEGVEDFAEQIEDKAIRYLATGASKTVYFTLELLEDVEPEEYAVDALLTTEEGTIVSRESFAIDLSEGVAKKSWLSGKAFWIIGDIVLIVVAIFFLKLIFGGRKPEVQEVKL